MDFVVVVLETKNSLGCVDDNNFFKELLAISVTWTSNGGKVKRDWALIEDGKIEVLSVVDVDSSAVWRTVILLLEEFVVVVDDDDEEVVDFTAILDALPTIANVANVELESE